MKTILYIIFFFTLFSCAAQSTIPNFQVASAAGKRRFFFDKGFGATLSPNGRDIYLTVTPTRSTLGLGLMRINDTVMINYPYLATLYGAKSDSLALATAINYWSNQYKQDSAAKKEQINSLSVSMGALQTQATATVNAISAQNGAIAGIVAKQLADSNTLEQHLATGLTGKTNTATTAGLSNAVNARVAYADTSSMLTNYARRAELTAGLAPKLDITTASTTYALVNHTHTISQVTGLQTILDGKQAAGSYYLASNPSGYISSVPAQTFASLTGKATTLSGYGITDAYPLTGNPSAFLTSITQSQINTALGYAPYNGTTNPNGFLVSYTETDPSVPSYSKSLTAFSVIKTSTDPLYKAIGYTPSSSEVTTALGFTPVTTARTITINGTAQDLSTNRNWAIPVTDTSSISARINQRLLITDTTSKWLWLPTTNNAPVRTLVTATNATGYRISTTRPAMVAYTIQFAYTINALSTLTGTAYSFLEISPDNSAWATVAQIGEQPALTLLTTKYFNFSCYVPAGWYVRQRTNITNVLGGTITLSPSYQQEVTN